LISLNKLALRVVDRMMDEAEEINVEVKKAGNGATLIDCGINVVGGYRTGLYVARVCLADLAELTLHYRDYGGLTLPVISQFVEHPVLACMASQYAGWKVAHGDYFAMGSGPARALAKKPKKLYKEIGYEDTSDEAVLVLETSKEPGKEVLDMVAEKCGVKPSDLYVLLVPTNSVAGSVQISARIAETGIHRLHTLGFPLHSIKHAAGVCPIAPVHPDPTIMMGWTNDALIYAVETFYVVDYEREDELPKMVESAVSSAASIYGKPFYEIFKEADYDFYKIDPSLFAPAKMSINSERTGKTYSHGAPNVEVLKRSWGL